MGDPSTRLRGLDPTTLQSPMGDPSTRLPGARQILATPESYDRLMDVARELHQLIDDLLGDDPRRALIAYRRLTVDEMPWIEQRVVALARRNGWNFARIGRLLGRTRQSVQSRFKSLPRTMRVDPMADHNRVQTAFHQTMRDIGHLRNPDPDPVAW